MAKNPSGEKSMDDFAVVMDTIKGKGPYGNIIFPVMDEEKAKIINDNEDLLKRLVDYKPYFKIEDGNHHQL